LEQIATGAPLGDTLAAIVQLVEDEFPDTVGSVLLLDRDGARLRPGAAPRLPPAYTAAIDGVAIGPRAGSCGTAAHTREPVYVADIGADPLWADFKALALAHGLRACWSTPVLGAPRGPGPRPVLGTFAVYARVPGAPPPRFAEVVARAEHLASVAIESDRADRELRESEERFRAYVDHAADALMLHDASGAVVDVNRQACASLGYARDELIGLTPADFDPDVTPEGLAGIFAGLGAGGTVAFDSRHRRKDGTVFPVDLRIRPFEMGGRRFHLALARDITERKSAEAALHRRLAELTALHRIGVACSQARTADEVLGRVTAVIAERFFPDNCGFLLLDAGRGVLVPHPSFVLTDPAVVRAEIPLDTGVTGRVARTGQPVRVGDVGAEPCYLAADPRTRSELCVPMTIGSKVVGVFNAEHRDPGAFSATDQQLLGTVVDLAGNALERLRAEESLRASEERYRDLVELSPEGVSILYEGTFVYVNRPGAGVLGLTPADLLGRPLAEFLHPDDVPVSRARQGAVVASGCAAPLHPFRLRHADGTWRVLESCAGPCRFEGKAAVQVLARDATERLRAEAALREREEQLRLFVDHVWAAIAMVGTDMRYIRTSRRWLTDYQLGPRDLTGLSFYEVFPETPERWKAVHRRCLAGAEERCEEDRFERADGTVQVLRWEIRPWRRADGAPAGLVIYTEDITARKRLEAHYQQVTKMEAVGRLAGGIAHDFNNLLTVINGFSDMALRGAGAADPHRAALTEIRAAGERAARLTQQLLAYSRKAMIEPKVLDLNELVTESVKMIRLVGEDVLVARALDPGPVRIRADRGQIEQVLMNLVVNARDAMPAGGRLAIETRTVTLGPDELPDDPDLRPGRYVRLTVADTGAGMTEEVRAKVFEPFFTTKEVGKGTGLGLAVAQGAVKQNGGHISVTSAVGAGTTFTLLFPAVPGAPGESGEAPPPPVRGTETLLLVEDEDAVRAVTRLGLEGYGYTVLAAGGGPAALALADRHPGHIDLLVTDVVMPHMGGRELAERLRHRRPGLRALFVSGYTDDVVLRHGLGSTADGFLQKPFTPQTLARKVREMMDQDG
ncbi:MAG TPA: PAS domain S-box protein, partial [Gemmata sp.]